MRRSRILASHREDRIPTPWSKPGRSGGVGVSDPPDPSVRSGHEAQSGIAGQNGGDHIRSDPVLGLALGVTHLDLEVAPVPYEAHDLTLGHATPLNCVGSPAWTTEVRAVPRWSWARCQRCSTCSHFP